MTKEEACKKISANKAEIDRLIQECVETSKESGVSFRIYIDSVKNSFVPKNAVQVATDPDWPKDVSYLDENGDEIYVSDSDDVYPGGWQESMC